MGVCSPGCTIAVQHLTKKSFPAPFVIPQDVHLLGVPWKGTLCAYLYLQWNGRSSASLSQLSLSAVVYCFILFGARSLGTHQFRLIHFPPLPYPIRHCRHTDREHQLPAFPKPEEEATNVRLHFSKWEAHSFFWMDLLLSVLAWVHWEKLLQ